MTPDTAPSAQSAAAPTPVTLLTRTLTLELEAARKRNARYVEIPMLKYSEVRLILSALAALESPHVP